MALKSIGILIALYAICTIAIAREIRFTPEHEYYRNPNNFDYGIRIKPTNDEYAVFKRPSFGESGKWKHQSFSNPDLYHNSETGVWIHDGHKYPDFPHNYEGLEDHLGHPFPHGFPESGILNYHGSHKPHISEESITHHGLHKPHFPYNPQESEEQNYLLPPHVSLSGEPEWGNKIHRPDWHNPQFSKHPVPLENYKDMERRRPLFYPIYPYHPFYPHAHPSTNDEEFETIEALKSKNQRSQYRRDFVRVVDSTPEDSQQQKYEGPYYHGPHNPHFPTNSDGTETSEEVPFGQLHNGLPYPHFKPFHKEPVLPEENFFSNDEFPNVDEAQPYGSLLPSENNEGFQGSLIIIGNDDHFKIPDIIFDILEHLHQGHGKPHRPEDNKPNDEDIVDEEGSGEEEVIPLSVDASIPLIQE